MLNTQKTIPPAPASRKKGIDAVAMAAYCWAKVTSCPELECVKPLGFCRTFCWSCTCNCNFPGLILNRGKVGRSPSTGDDDEEERGGDQAVEDQHQEHQHVVGLQIYRC